MFDRRIDKSRAKKTSAQRSSILRGVYDQNRGLRTAGACDRRRSPASRALLLLVTLPLLVAAALLLFPAALSTEAGVAPPQWSSGLVRSVENVVALRQTGTAATAPETPTHAQESLSALAEPMPPILDSMSPAVESTSASLDPSGADGNALELALASVASGDGNLKSLFGLSVKTIVIDAGHGGHDPGTTGELGTREKDITLDVARRLRDRLEESGAYRILMVRDEDVFVPLRQRAAFANTQGVDLFVSIHVNYLPSISTNAVETYYFGRYEDARTRELAERENQGSDYSLNEFEGLMRKVQDTVKLQESKALAHAIQDNLLNSIRSQNQRVLNNGVRTAPFMVLLGVKAPSVLVEIGSLSSADAERNMRKETYRDKIASYVAAGITEYLNQEPAQEHGPNEDKNRLSERQ